MKILLLLLPALLAAQTPQFPSNIATDGQLKIASNNIVTKIPRAVTAGDTLILVLNPAGIVPNMLLTIDVEIMNVVSVAGNQVTVTRGFDGTLAVAHQANRPVSANVDAWHNNSVKAEVTAIETTLGPNLVNITNPPASASIYTFTANPAGTLTGGVLNAVTMTPCPRGVSGADTGHAIRVNNAESVLIAGGSCTSGASSGSLFLSPVASYTAGYTLTSATGGIQEAVCVLPTTGGAANISTNVTLTANVSACSKTNLTLHRSPGVTITGAFTILGNTPAATTESADYTSGAVSVGSAISHWSFMDASPDLTAINGNWNQARFTVNNASGLVEFGSYGNYPTTSAVTGANDATVNGGATWHGQAMGVAGGVRGGNGPNVGVFGNCWADVSPVGGCWGANFVTNGKGVHTNLWGIETDINTDGPPATLPNQAWGQTIVSAAYGWPIFDYLGLAIQKADSPLHQHYPFKNSIASQDGAALHGFELDAIYKPETLPILFSALPAAQINIYTVYYCSDCTGGFALTTCAGGGTGAFALGVSGAWKCINNDPAQDFQFTGLDSTNTRHRGGVSMDGVGNLQMFADPNALLILTHAAGNPGVSIFPDSSVNLPGVNYAALGAPTLPKMQWCKDCTVASTCSNAGSGAWAFSNGSRWSCPF